MALSWNTLRRTLAPLTLNLTMVVGLGCADDTDATMGGTDTAGTDGPGSCVPGHSLACTCTDGRPGAQVCEADGSGYGACSCDAGSGSSTTSTSGGSDSGPEPTGGEETGTPAIPSWTDDIVPIFYDSCGAGISGCHNREAYGANAEQGCRGWLSLEDEAIGSIYYGGMLDGQSTGCPDMALYDRLTALAPWQCDPSSAYVDPGSPETSYIMQKIAGQVCAAEFEPMPPPDSGIMISDQDVATLEAWIAAGAPFDG